MFDDSGNRPSVWSRLLADPLRLRRQSRLALAVAAMLAAITQYLSGGFLAAMVTAVLWIAAPVIAFGIGAGDAFFVQHGRGRRRVILSIALGVFVALASCIAIDYVEPSGTAMPRLLGVIFYAVLYISVVIGLSGVIAFGVGMGADYAARRIGELSDEDW